jgi:hypothetical protein
LPLSDTETGFFLPNDRKYAPDLEKFETWAPLRAKRLSP